jgi:hypothetical protein
VHRGIDPTVPQAVRYDRATTGAEPGVTKRLDLMAVRLAIVAAVLALVLGACSTAPATSSASPQATAPAPATGSASPSASLSAAAAWAEDLAQLDKALRASHPAPFTIHPESEWTAKLAEIQKTLPGAAPDEQLVQLASLVGLLDTHSGLSSPTPDRLYALLLYRFSDGWFVIRAADSTLVGMRLLSIGGVPIEEVEKRLTPLVPHDNKSGLLDGMQGMVSSVSFLHGAGIVATPASPTYVLQAADGAKLTAQPRDLGQVFWEDQLGVTGDLVGEAPEAVSRRGAGAWTKLDAADRVFLISYSDYVDPSPLLAQLKQSLDGGQADRVVVDLRYLRGGTGNVALPLVSGLQAETRVNRPGGLTVLIGRENVSAGTVIVRRFDDQTKAVLVGEPTPARADNFLCDCLDITLEHSGFVVTIPTQAVRTGDSRPEIAPDISMALSSTDFFAGRDPVLDAALKGTLPSPT